MSVSRQLARFAHDLRYEEIPSEVIAKAKTELLDTIGICLASASMPFADGYVHALTSFDHSADAAVLGRRERFSAANAALLNGTFAHGLDFDDTHVASIVHVSASLLPTALAVAEWTGRSGQELLAALIVGYEINIRVGLAAAGAFHARGFHPTALCAMFGCAAVAGRLLGLDEDQLTHALGLAGSQAGGLQQFLKDGSEVKRLHAGWAAHAGIMAAVLAQGGLTGPEHVLEGEFGFYRTHLGTAAPDEGALLRELGSTWETLNISIKPYPCCHFLHAYMDLALDITRQEGLTVEDIAGIECMVPETVARLVCEPEEMKKSPKVAYDALFSLPYCVASMLVRGRAALQDFTVAALGDQQVAALANLISYRIDTEWSDFPKHFSGWVRLKTHDGRVFEARDRFNKGCPERPLAAADIASKFMSNATLRLSEARAQEVLGEIMSLDEKPSLNTLTRLCIS